MSCLKNKAAEVITLGRDRATDSDRLLHGLHGHERYRSGTRIFMLIFHLEEEMIAIAHEAESRIHASAGA